MKISRLLIKGSAVFTLIAFLFTSSGWAQVPAVPSVPEEFLIPAEIKIPESLGSVQSLSLPEGSSKPLVLYIQDAHAILDAQANIRKLIAHFQSVYPVSQVLLEGLGGTMDTHLLRAYPDAFVREKIMKEYFSRGEITGAEMAAVLNKEKSSYRGLEDWKLYEENTRAYLEASANRPMIESELLALQKEIDTEMNHLYSPEQKELHRAVESFSADTGAFSEWTNLMLRFRKEADTYPNLKRFLDAAAEENQTDGKKEQAQIERMAEAFRMKQLGRLSAENQRAFQEKFQAFRTHALEAGAFLQSLMAWGSPLSVKPRLNPELEALLKRHETLSALRGNALFDEIDAFTFEIENKAAKTPESRRILEKTRDLRLMKKLAALELTRKEWETLFQKRPEYFSREIWQPSVRFYQLALKRDGVFHEKLKKAADGEKSEVIIVLAGGFHAQGFESFFKENHYPYASIVPAMTSFVGKEKYEILMRGDVSWSSDIRDSLYDGFMRHTVHQLKAALNPQEQPAQMKNWRDEILRMLAKEGRSADAGKYLKYLEAEYPIPEASEIQKVIEKYKAETMANLRQTFEMQFKDFAAGFEKLAQTQKLNPETITALITKSSTLSPSLAKFDPSYRGGFTRIDRAEVFAGASLNQMRAENRVAADPIYRDEFIAFLEGGLSNDLPTGDITHLGSVGQRVRETLSYLLDHYQHYHYVSESEMWGDLLDILWQRRESFHSHLSETLPANHYIETAVKHALIDRYRKMRRELKEGAAGTDSRDPESVLDEILEDVHDRPDQSAIASESSVYLAKALAHLTPEEAQLIHMHFWDQLNYHEIAETMKLNEGTVRNRILRAMESLKSWLPHHDWAEEEPKPVSEVPDEDARALDAAILSLSGIRGGKKHPEKTFRVQRVAALYRDGFDYAEISHQTGLVDGTTRRTIHQIKELLGRQNPQLVATLLKLRSENGGQIQHREEKTEEASERNENRYIEVENGQLIRIGDIQQMRLLVTLFQQEEDAYIQDTFTLDEINLTAEPKKRASQHAPDRIFVYDPMGQLLEKRSLGSIFPMHETYDELLSKKTKDLKSPFEKEVGILQDLLRGLIHPFLEEMGLEDRKDEVLLSFEKDYDSDGLPVFHLHFKLLGLGPLLTEEDFLAVPAHDRAAFQHAFEFWYPYFYVRSSIDLAEQEASAARDEKLARKYTAQRLSAYAGALERVGEATHVIYQTHGLLDEMFVAGQVETFLNWAEEDLRLAFPEHAPEYNLILPRLRELMTLRQYSLPLVHILIQKYESIRHETRLLEQPRVTIYGGADDRGPGSSSFLLEIGNSKILIDAGQDVRRRIGGNRPEHLDAILLSHAHGDHAGDLPWISAMFPETRVYATGATRDTALLMLDDSASFQTPSERGLFRRNIQSLKTRFIALDPKLWYQVTPEVKVRFQPASHILGASLIYIATPYRNYVYTGDFSGDPIRSADKLELLEDFPVDELWEESTYGNMTGDSTREERERLFAQDAARIAQRNGKILIPTFALGRTADVAVTIRHYQELGIIPPDIPVYVDGLAAFNLESYIRYIVDSEDPEEQKVSELLEDNIIFVNPRLRDDILEGKIPGPFFILGGSGSLAGGRALQYFSVIAVDSNNAVITVGYQFPGTIGRRMKDGEREFKIDGETVIVRAELPVHDFGAHARQKILVSFAERTKPRFTFLIHGEIGAKEALKDLLQAKVLNVSIPKTGDVQRAAEDTDELLDSRSAYFNQIASVPVSEIKKKQPKPHIYEDMTELEQQDVIGGILVAIGRKSRDPEGQAMVRELIEKKRAEAVVNPFTATILELRAQIHQALDTATLREKGIARMRLWNDLQRRTGRPVDVIVPAEKPKQPRPPKRDPALVIAERYQRTLDEFSLSITDALRKRGQAEIPSTERIREVVGVFLHQNTVQIEEGQTPLKIAIMKPDGGLNSGNVARAMQYYLGPANVSKEERWMHAWEGLNRNFGERRENRAREETDNPKSLLPLLLPPPETLAARQNLNGIAEEAENKIQDAGAIFDRLEDVVSGKISSVAIAMEARETLGLWADWMDVTGFSEEIAEVNLRNSSLTENSFSLAKQFLSRPDLVRKYFSEVFSPAESVALESDLLFSLSPDAGEIQPALKSAFRWTGILYPKKSSAEKQILEMVKQDGQHFAAIPYDGKSSVRSLHLGIQGETPLVWLPEGVLNFAGDKMREKEFKALGFQIKSEVLPLLAAQKLTLNEALMLLKLFSLSPQLRSGLIRAQDGFLVLDGEGLKAGIQTLAALWSQEAENIRLLSLSA